jgi:hypothetical protein
MNYTLTLTQDEINEVLNCLDLAVKQSGLHGAKYFALANNVVAQTSKQNIKPQEKENGTAQS